VPAAVATVLRTAACIGLAARIDGEGRNKGHVLQRVGDGELVRVFVPLDHVFEERLVEAAIHAATPHHAVEGRGRQAGLGAEHQRLRMDRGMGSRHRTGRIARQLLETVPRLTF